LDLDTVDSEYYEKVAKQIENIDLTKRNVRVSRYYVHKITPFFVNGERYYEITLQLAGVYSTKYNRVTVYSKMTITTYYSIQIAYTETELELWGIRNNIKVLNDWKVAIDPTCLNKLSKMLMKHTKINRNYQEYVNLMEFLTETGMNLFELINMRKERFSQIYNRVFGTTNTHDFGDVLIQIRREYSKSSCKVGKNTIGYAMLHMRDEILEDLLPNKFYPKRISEKLFVSSRCYPFEKNPMIANLVGTKTSKKDKESIIELLDDSKVVSLVQPYMTIDNLISETGELLFKKSEIGSDAVIENYNTSLDDWERDKGYFIIEKEGLVTIASYYDTTINILKRLLQLTHNVSLDRQEENERFIKNCGIKFDDIDKKIALKHLFVNSNIMLIYGAAGTGKTTLINYISRMFGNARKLYLTKTHTALQNVIRSLDKNIDNCDFEIIDSITRSNSAVIHDIVFIDECSTIDNRTMELLLGKISNDALIVMSGDIYQIESIDFGNWFFYAKDIVKAKGASIELSSTWRTEKEELKGLWKAVREKSTIVTEMLSMEGPFSENLGENIFHLDEDEVVLCLNYDGKFGLNNMNQYFQNANTNSKAFSWEEWSYKIGDRIIFTNTRRSTLLYNNLKGTIINISYAKKSIIFEIEVKAFLTECQCEEETFDYVDTTEKGTIIRLEVVAWDDDLSEEEKVKTVIPFQLAYAISIHKAQGLEYKSVKIVIPSSNAEKITHSIFYTAITRAKEKLKIF
jgi:helicase, putative